ncbi:MAG: hypothetical protein IPK10_18925 [Bacteroidetes bacterium]|nr:hypothetical protein [Bacteroidota bacterium]
MAKTIGGLETEYVTSVIKTPDNGLLLGSYTESGIGGSKTEICKGEFDYWIIKLDSIGNIQWQKTFGGNSYDLLLSLSNSSDGGYFLEDGLNPEFRSQTTSLWANRLLDY